MTDHGGHVELPTAGVHRRRRIPLIWIVPIVTGLIAMWLAWDTFSKKGPTITIAFDSAAGLTAGQSQLKYKNVVMGTVKSIAIAPDLTKVIVTIDTVREAEPLLTDKTIFWVVKPELFAGNITGLETLISGSYIGMRPSAEKGSFKRDFIGEQDPPVLTAWTKGTTFLLDSKRLGSISLGSPIFFRDIEVGTVLGWDIGDLASRVTIHAFVRAPYDQYVHTDTLFWNASGISLKLGSDGVQFRMESLRALLLGGIAFETSLDTKQPAATAKQEFTLYRNFEEARAVGFGRQIRLLSYFPGSVAGLEPGAHVTLHGLRIGEVTDVDLVYDPKLDRIVVPVHYRVEAGRISNIAAADQTNPEKFAEEMIRRGMRATLQSTSIITGSKEIALERVDEAVPATLEKRGDVYVVPTSEVGGFDAITRSAAELLTKLNRIEYDKIGRSLEGAAAGLDTMINGDQMKRTLTALEKAMVDVQDIAKKLDTEGTPALKRLPAIAQQLQESLTSANRLFGSFNTGYGDDSRFRRDLDRLLPQLTDAARSIRALSDLLSRHPEALIKGRTNTGKE
ncbi:PqiB family protein [Reyranella soli]|jgi:paraquat-inducible protein B|uniref:Paraquat-inducible protein n=1 Tax=Reyranella soli TaxID=1230389 RepID=A0A512N9Z6_9HYPH|nr:MlaD family protein [Reyranella soli]GEP55763.1 paraquat-inducible protein [Reyranella soli]